MSTKGIRGRKSNNYLAGNQGEQAQSADNEAQVPQVSPEAMEVVHKYVEYLDTDRVANELQVSKDTVDSILLEKPVQKYMNSLFTQATLQDKWKLIGIIDEIIEDKYKEAMESQIFSKKDLLTTLKECVALKKELVNLNKELEGNTKKQGGVAFNQQNNITVEEGSNLEGLVGKLLRSEK